MKTIYTFGLLLFSITFCFSQDFYNDFEDGTLENWTNVDGTITNMSVEGDTPQRYLQKICDGSATALGQMAIVNAVDYVADYTCNDPQGINCFGALEILLRNDNSFDLNIRLGFMSSDGTQIVLNQAVVVPAGSGWSYIEFPYEFGYSVVGGPGTVASAFADVQEMRIIHNANISYDGEIVNGNLDIDHVFSIILLGAEEQFLQETAMYPNPTENTVNFQFPSETKTTITLYDRLGRLMMTTNEQGQQASLDVSTLQSGMYFAKIQVGEAIMTKKILKR